MPRELKRTISVCSERPCGGFHFKTQSYINPSKGPHLTEVSVELKIEQMHRV